MKKAWVCTLPHELPLMRTLGANLMLDIWNSKIKFKKKLFKKRFEVGGVA